MVKVRLKSGVVREYSDRDARLLVLVKKGTIVTDEPTPSPVQSTVENPPVEKIAPVENSAVETPTPEKPKRAYSRKDLKAA
jgi:hypothetical protein